MTSHLDSHTTTDVRPEMLSGVRTRNGIPHDKYNTWHCPCVHKKKRQHFHTKATLAKLYIYIGVVGVGAGDLYIDEGQMALDIFRFAVFFLATNRIPRGAHAP